MRKLFIIVILVNNSFSVSAQNTKLEEEMFNGLVKCMFQESYSSKMDHTDSIKLDSKLIYTFDTLGLLVRRQGLGQDIFYINNSNQELIKSSIRFENGGKEYGSNEFYYNNGKLIKHIYKIIPTKKVTSSFEYFVTYYNYDQNNKLIEEKQFSKRKGDKNETLNEYNKYKYDTVGNCIIKECLENGEVVERIQNKYLNHILTESFTWQKFEGEDLFIKDLYTYNTDETMSSHKKIIYSYGTTDQVEVETVENYSKIYDNQKRLIEEKNELNDSFQGTIKVINIYYSNFDNKSNWQRKIIEEEGTKKNILRKFEYYE
jgi:hypothetical protein